MRATLQRQKEELQQAVDENQRLATLDELTGLVNRRHMGAVLRSVRERGRRGGEGMSIAPIDIDSFKRVNDEHGHAAGDSVLREFSMLGFPSIAATMRATLSAGIATHFERDTVEARVAQADQNMCAAKAAGRNRICSEDTQSPPRRVSTAGACD